VRYYDCGGYPLCSREVLALPALHALPEAGEVLFGFHRTPGAGRDTFPVTAPSLLTAEEGVSTLVTAEEPETDSALAAAIAAGRVRAVNLTHPRYEELLPPLRRRERVRVNLLALGDVGSTLLMGLRLLGGDVIDSIGICDVRENVPQRWEMELNQIVSPEGERLPPVEIVSPEEVFDGDVFLFCASRFVPDTSVTSGDVRMAQYQVNRELAVRYARMARQRRYGGMFCVVSDPVDPLCRAVLEESNRDETGRWDGGGLFSHQVRGFGLGVMNARAAYFAKQDPRFRSFLLDGRSYGPHGQGLVIANSLSHYDDGLSRELTELVATANLRIRELGFKPYVAPAISSGAMQLLLTLRRSWHCSSVALGGIWFGVRNRLTAAGLEIETASLPTPLFERLRETQTLLREII